MPTPPACRIRTALLKASRRPFPIVELVFADSGYSGETAEDAALLAGPIPHLLVFEKPAGMLWPGHPGEVLDWTREPPKPREPAKGII